MSEQLAPETVLAEVGALRRRTRAARHAYWLPLLVLALAHLAAVPFYLWTRVDDPPADPLGQVASGPVYYGPEPDRIGSYWLGALLLVGLVTVGWYRRRGRQVGVEGRVTGAVVAAVVAVIAYAVLRLLPLSAYPFPVYLPEFGALLVVAVGLLALAWLERSRGLLAVATLYSAAAVLANTYTVSNVGGGFWGAGDSRYMFLPALLLPAVILLAGGLAAGTRSGLARRRSA
jgi:hypothetical protein